MGPCFMFICMRKDVLCLFFEDNNSRRSKRQWETNQQSLQNCRCHGRLTKRAYRTVTVMSLCARMIAALSLTLSLTLVATARSSDNSNGDTDASLVESEIVFPEDEFSQFSSCLFAGQFEQCIAYLTLGEFNVTVDGVAEGDPSEPSEEPCRYYTCDSSIPDIAGEFVCNRQTKSAACKTRRESQFLREPANAQRQSTCVLVYFSERIDRFKFDEQASFDSCNASCSCETSITTTHESSSYTDTTTVPPTSTETTSATTTTTFAAKATTTTTTAAKATTTTANTTTTLPSAPDTRDGKSRSNVTNGISKTINESSVNANETIEVTGSNDTLMGEDNNETGLIVGVIVAVVGVCLIAVGILFILCKVLWKNDITQSIEENTMDRFINLRSSGDLQLDDIGASGQDSEASARLLSTTTKGIIANAETIFATVQEETV